MVPNLHYIGATYANQWDVEKSTHLVTNELKATAKHIMAWACRRPVVTIKYLHALLARTSPSQPLPNEAGFNPPGETQLENLSSGSEPSKALRGYQLACLAEDDCGPLALSAGAEVILFPSEAPDNEAEFETWWKAKQQEALKKKLALVAVHSSSRKCSQWRSWLENIGKGKEEMEVVRFTNAKNLAKAITANKGMGELLKDVNGGFIDNIYGEDDSGNVSNGGDNVGEKCGYGADQPEVTEDMKQSKKGSRQPTDDVEEQVSMQEDPQQQQLQLEEEPTGDVAFDGGNDHIEETAHDNDDDNDEAEANANSYRRKGNQEVVRENRNEQEEEDEEGRRKRRRKQNEEEPEDHARAQRQTSKDATPVNKRREVRLKRPDDERPMERIPLPTTDDGWFIAAPSKRTAYRKSVKEIEELGEENAIKESAQTALVTGLIVRDYVPQNSNPALPARAASSKSKTKDFKRFRKNVVMRGYSTFAPTYISSGQQRQNQTGAPSVRLVSVLPKESERQRQLEMQQMELEREQEAADALFNDGGGGKSRGGRGSMQGYFSQASTATKRSRGRGRRG